VTQIPHSSSGPTSKKKSVDAMLVVVKMTPKPLRKGRGVWSVCVYVNGRLLIRPRFQKRKPAVNLAAMMVQQGLIHGWHVSHQVLDEQGKLTDVNLAALGNRGG